MSSVPMVGEEKERCTKISPGWYLKRQPRYLNNLEEYWPCTGGLSALNTIGAQLRELISSGLI